MFSLRKFGVIPVALGLIIVADGCKKKTPPPPPPPPPTTQRDTTPTPPPASAPQTPVIGQFTAEPSTIERGQSSTLRWSVTGATTMSIDQGIGNIEANGTRRVFPGNAMTYTLSASGPGGTTSATASVNVTTAAIPPPPAPISRGSLEQRLSSEVQDVYFDYDHSDIREDARAVLTRNADAIKALLTDFPNANIVVEGHCDERGSAEYNLGLGDRRATSAKDFLVQLGVPGDHIRTISYGKERPQCTEASETCFGRNRRAHFAAGQ